MNKNLELNSDDYNQRLSACKSVTDCHNGDVRNLKEYAIVTNVFDVLKLRFLPEQLSAVTNRIKIHLDKNSGKLESCLMRFEELDDSMSTKISTEVG